jgi:hypothetical protein
MDTDMFSVDRFGTKTDIGSLSTLYPQPSFSAERLGTKTDIGSLSTL